MPLRRFWNRRTGPPAEPRSTAVHPASERALMLHPIGFVRNAERQPRPNDWQAVESRIEIAPQLVEALRGIEGFSHILVLTWLHLAAAEPRELLSLPSAGDRRLPRIGVLALRVPGRPNPIGCSVVRLLTVEGSTLQVQGLDAIDGTPVLDLKPYLPLYDSVPDARLPEWASF